MNPVSEADTLSDERPEQQEKLKTELLTVNMGPQHPATHGVLRVEIKTDGEVVADAVPHIGYLHRCMEKHSEAVDYRGVLPFVDRMDYLGAMNQELSYSMACEKLLGLEVPRRAMQLRMMICELNRIASHLLFFGTYAIDLGAFTPFLYAFVEREKILRLFEELSGARLLYNYLWIGGLWSDMSSEQVEYVQDFCDHFLGEIDKYNNLLTHNEIFINRTANIGVISPEMAYDYGATGPVLRGSGVSWDLRKVSPYMLYNEVEFEVPVGKGEKGALGDCWDRYFVRLQEMRESVNIIRQLCTNLEEGPIMCKVPKVIRPETGEVFLKTEAARGELGIHLFANGDKNPYRLKVKSPCFTHISMIGELAPGMMIADLVALIGSLDIVLGEVDR